MRETVKIKSRFSAEKRKPTAFWILAGLILPAWSCMVRYRFTPESKLPETGPFILAPNHYSEVDPIAIGGAIWHMGRLPRFMAKASLFAVPVLGYLMRKTGQIPVQRAGSRPEPGSNPLSAANILIENEQGVIVYPEGTLTRDPDLWPMRGKGGAVRLALESGIALIPAAQWGAQELMPRYSKRLKPFPRKTIYVTIGEPLDLSRFAGRPIDARTVNEATDVLMQEIARLVGELREETPPPERWDPANHQQTETGRF